GPTTTFGFLGAVTALSADDAWAAGTYYDGSQNMHKTLALHWDGSAWSIISTPNVGTSSNWLRSMAGSGSNDVWAVGSVGGQIGNPDIDATLTIHWDGTAWSVMSSPSPGTGENYLYGVTALSAQD